MATYQGNTGAAAPADNGLTPDMAQSRPYEGDAAAAPAPAGNASEAKSGMSVVTTPKFIVRCITWLTCLIAFACMASFPYYKWESSFEFLLAANVISWVWLMGILVASFFRRQVDAQCGFFAVVEFIGDGIMLLFTFISACVSASDCQSKLWKNVCKHFGESNAAIAFGFISAFLFIVIMVFSVIEHRKMERNSA